MRIECVEADSKDDTAEIDYEGDPPEYSLPRLLLDVLQHWYA